MKIEYWTTGDVDAKKHRRRQASEQGFINKHGSLKAHNQSLSDNFNQRLPRFMRSIGLDPADMTPEQMRHEWGMHFGKKIEQQSAEQQAITLTKRFATNLEKYSSKGTLGNAIVQQKYRDTNMAVRGVEYVLQDPAIFAKAEASRLRRKDYTMPSGAVIRVQGYEPWALDRLLTDGIAESDFVIGGGQVSIAYVDVDGRNRKFYPDIYIASQNRIIEVKSTYTYAMEQERNRCKQTAAQTSGYACEFWIFDGAGNLQTI